MSKWRVAIALAVLSCSSAAQAQQSPTQNVLSYRLAGLNSGLRLQTEQLRAAVKVAEANYTAVKSEKPAPRAERIQEAEARLRLAQAGLSEAEAKLARETRLSILERPIDVKLTQASVQQAALVLSEAAGMAVIVDAGVELDKRLSVDAKGVTFGLVLETLAKQTNLMLAPDAKGIRITTWPTLEVDGQKTVRKSAYAPWSEEWATYLYCAGGSLGQSAPFGSGGGVVYSRGGPDGFGTEAPAPAAGAPVQNIPAPFAGGAPGLSGTTAADPVQYQGGGTFGTVGPGGYGSGFIVPGGYPGMGMAALPQAAGNVAVTSLGDRAFVVAEPGVGQQGERGSWLTVYRLEGNQLRKISSTFHQHPQGGPMMMPMMPGMPGMGRAPGMMPGAPSVSPKYKGPNKAVPGMPAPFGEPKYKSNKLAPAKPAPQPYGSPKPAPALKALPSPGGPPAPTRLPDPGVPGDLPAPAPEPAPDPAPTTPAEPPKAK
jgi:hypothetical protein